MKIRHDVSGTAFVVNYSRSRREDLSQDVYAHLWVTQEAMSLWQELAEKVYPNDDLNVGLRTRFYLERLREFVASNRDPVGVSIAAGFDNYPFLIEGKFGFMEIDFPNIIDFKRKKVAEWMRDGILPRRRIEYFSIDLNDDVERREMKRELKDLIGERPSFVMMEGLTYYLKIDVLNDIFGMLRKIQTEGSIVLFDYWKPDALEYPVMRRLKDYLKLEFGSKSQEWTLFDKTYISGLMGFTEIESTDIAELELRYSSTRIFQGRENKIPANYSVLKRT